MKKKTTIAIPVEVLSPSLLANIKKAFDIRSDTDKGGTIENIQEGLEFRGPTTWALIFAIFVASIGLNTNSTAVIIGAMLISPLMGPIMGAGLALGIGDLDIFRKSARNLVLMTVTALLTSTIYFALSPLKEAQSELLNRTYPTIYDVLIAVFGGSIGIIASSRENKFTNVIPGVAIATALMPPLCTAGYGIANGSFSYFIGAMYLYALNSFFIGFSTFVFVKYLKIGRASAASSENFARVRKYAVIAAVLLVLPSIYMAYNVIKQTATKQKVSQYIEGNFKFERSKVINTTLQTVGGKMVLEVSMIGEPISTEMIDHLRENLQNFGLGDVGLRVIQNASGVAKAIPVGSPNDTVKDGQIELLQRQLREMTQNELKLPRIAREVNLLFPELLSISYGNMTSDDLVALNSAKEFSIFLEWKRGTRASIKKKLEVFLKMRLNTEKISFVEPAK
jgi:uncharacterized hydrophobic protein (TIGR00271 family)